MSTYCKDVWVVELLDNSLNVYLEYFDNFNAVKERSAADDVEAVCKYVDVQKLLDAEAEITRLRAQLNAANAALEIAQGEIKALSEYDWCMDEDAESFDYREPSEHFDYMAGEYKVGAVIKFRCIKELPPFCVEITGIKYDENGDFDEYEYVIKEAE